MFNDIIIEISFMTFPIKLNTKKAESTKEKFPIKSSIIFRIFQLFFNPLDVFAFGVIAYTQ